MRFKSQSSQYRSLHLEDHQVVSNLQSSHRVLLSPLQPPCSLSQQRTQVLHNQERASRRKGIRCRKVESRFQGHIDYHQFRVHPCRRRNTKEGSTVQYRDINVELQFCVRCRAANVQTISLYSCSSSCIVRPSSCQPPTFVITVTSKKNSAFVWIKLVMSITSPTYDACHIRQS